MRSLGLQATQQELQEMMTEADEDGSGFLGEYINAIASLAFGHQGLSVKCLSVKVAS